MLQVALASSTAARTDPKVARSHRLIIQSHIRRISIASFTRSSVNPTKSSSWRFTTSISVALDQSKYLRSRVSNLFARHRHNFSSPRYKGYRGGPSPLDKLHSFISKRAAKSNTLDNTRLKYDGGRNKMQARSSSSYLQDYLQTFLRWSLLRLCAKEDEQFIYPLSS